MKKSIIAASAASLALAAMPVASTFAARPTVPITDNLSVNIAITCNMTRSGVKASTGAVVTASSWTGNTGTDTGTYAVTMVGGKAAQIGTSTLVTNCNDTANGFDVAAQFTGLSNHDSTPVTIGYDGSTAVADNVTRWNITNNGTLVTATNGAGTIRAQSTTPVDGAENEIVYNVSTNSALKADTYEGSAVYTLTYGASE